MLLGELEKWLQEIGLAKFAGTFAEHEIGLPDLPLLTDDDLKELGIPLGPRRRLQSALQQRQAASHVARDDVQSALSPPGERRQVTVLFADLSDFTRMASELDAEELHGVLNRYFQAVDAIIHRFGGRIDKHIGDGVMAVFGAPVAHTNDPERSVRAACEIRSAMPSLGESAGRAMHAHIGIASGLVVASGTGSDAHKEYTVTGEIVNIAARLSDLAVAGEILITDAVHAAVSSFCNLVDRGELVIKGLRVPSKTWAVEGLRSERQRRDSGVLVARRMELRQFGALLQGCAETGHGCSLLVRGDPGIGKSRLVEEFAEEASRQGFATVRGLVLDFGVTHGNDAISALAYGLLDLPVGCSVAERQDALDKAIAAGGLEGAKRVFGNALLNLPQSAEQAILNAEMSNSAREGGSCAAFADLALAKASEVPLLVIVEDIHWIDAAGLAHLSSLVRAIANSPVMLVMTTRIEGISMQRDWSTLMSGSPLSVMELQPLRAEDCYELAAILGATDRDEIQALVNRSGGNPLYLELLMRNSDEALVGKLPQTLQGLVLARVDRLPKQDREALQAGSVVGQRLSQGLLRHLIGDAHYDCRALVENRMLRADGDGYLFDHALIRDGVYSSLLKDRRRALHRRAAEWFAETDPALHAEHLDRADDPLAPSAYLEAARFEARRHRTDKALLLVERGLKLETNQVTRFALLCLKGDILEVLNKYEDSSAAYRAATDIAQAQADRCRSLLGQSLALLRLDRHSEAETLLGEAETIAANLDLTGEMALIHRRRATIEFARGNAQSSFEYSKIALAKAEECGLHLLRAEALSCMADAEAASGKFASAFDHYSMCIEICREHGYRRFAIINTKMLGDNAFYRGELTVARTKFNEVVEEAVELVDTRSEALARSMLIYLDCLAGRSNEAIHQAQLVREQILRMNIRRFLMNNHCLMAMALRAGGRWEDALAQLRDAEVLAKELDVVWAMPWVLGEKALSLRNPVERRASLDEGMALLDAGHGGYFTFEFYRPAIEAALEMQDWPRVEKLCMDLAATMGDEPVGFAFYVIERAKAIAALMQGGGDGSALLALREQAESNAIIVDLAIMDAALAT